LSQFSPFASEKHQNAKVRGFHAGGFVMVRTALRGTTARPSLRVAATVELLDRTGIIAASLPQRRRTELKSDGALAATPDLSAHEPQPPDKDLRPRSVVIHRRATTWIGAVGAVALLAIGWFAGGTFAGEKADNAAHVEVQQNVVEKPAVVPPVPPPVVSATGTVQVPAEHSDVTHSPPATSKAQRPAVTAAAEPRVDLPAKPTTGKPQPLVDLGKQVAALWAPYVASLPHVGALSGRY
jgi:hypothetical protein